MRLLSIVEATSVTGPVKPLLMFSKIARAGVGEYPPIEHTLLTSARGRTAEIDNDLLRAARADGLEVDVIPEYFRFDPGVLSRMAYAIRKRSPDVLETHDFKSHFLVWILRRTGAVVRPKWVAFHHGYTQMSLRVRAYQQLDRFSLRNADRVVTLCEPFVQDLLERGVSAHRMMTISNAIEPKRRPHADALSALRRSLGVEDTDVLIVSVGRLSREKGNADLIRAFKLLLQESPAARARLLFVGDGGERSSLMSQAVGLGDRILFVGHQSDPWPYFCAADLFVLSSHTEGSPLVLFEAMAAGLPIIATSVGGVPEVVENGSTAMLVPAGDAQRLAGVLRELVNSRERAAALGAAAYDSLRRFSPEKYSTRLANLYRNVISGDYRV
jgi:glycosyltransferase involved in cell wall biosynthesis